MAAMRSPLGPLFQTRVSLQRLPARPKCLPLPVLFPFPGTAVPVVRRHLVRHLSHGHHRPRHGLRSSSNNTMVRSPSLGKSCRGLLRRCLPFLFSSTPSKSIATPSTTTASSSASFSSSTPHKPYQDEPPQEPAPQHPQQQHATTKRSVLAARVPPGSWDSHMHVFDTARYPLPPTALYRAPDACTTDEATAFEASLGLAHIVLVQPSCYGNDNACMLETLRALGPGRARAVVMFDPAATAPAQLQAWHDQGVRGVRINLQSVNKSLDAAALRATLQTYADAVRPLGWVVQIYVPLATVALLEDVVPDLGVRVCIDHIGHPDLGRAQDDAPLAPPYDLPGFASLVALLRGGHTYVKLSGAYRFSRRADYEDVRPLVQEVLRVAGRDRAVFATDWPHTRFEGLDIATWVEKVLDWCGDDEALVQAVFRDTARELWK